MKAHYVSSMQTRVVVRANGVYRLQQFNAKLGRDVGEGIIRGTRTNDPWENVGPAFTREQALIELRRFETNPEIKQFLDRNGYAIGR